MGMILTECVQSKLSLVKESHQNEGKRFLGTLRGVCAECDKPTRNDRIYSRALWEKVLNSESVKEGLENKVIYGELGHPEDRLESDIEKIAICFSGYEIQPDGEIIGDFDILDTPSGQLLKSLVDYGSILGISSRGGGDTVMREGRTYVREDDYQFMCFDIVLTPGVKKARLGLAEGLATDVKDVKPIQECVKQVIETTTNSAALQNLKNILEQLDVPNKDELMSALDEKLSTSNGETIPSTILEDLRTSQEKVKSLEGQLNESITALQAETIRSKKLEEKLGKIASSSKIVLSEAESLKTQLQEEKRNKGIVEKKLNDDAQAICEEKAVLEAKLNAQQSNYDMLSEQLKVSEDTVYKLRNKMRQLTEEAVSMRKQEREHRIQLKQIKEQCEAEAKQRYDRQMSLLEKDNSIQINSLREKLQRVSEEKATIVKDREQVIKAFADMCAKIYGISTQSVLENINKPFNVISKRITEAVENKKRLSALPFVTNTQGFSYKGLNEEVVIEEAPADYGVSLLLQQQNKK